MKLRCPNCSQKFQSENALCPSCGWDRNPDPQPVVEDESTLEMVPGPAFQDLERLNVGQLRPMARDLGINKWYRMVKDKLIEAIKSKRANAK